MLRKRIKKNTLKWKKIYAEQLLDMMDEEENALQKIYLTGYGNLFFFPVAVFFTILAAIGIMHRYTGAILYPDNPRII